MKLILVSILYIAISSSCKQTYSIASDTAPKIISKNKKLLSSKGYKYKAKKQISDSVVFLIFTK